MTKNFGFKPYIKTNSDLALKAIKALSSIGSNTDIEIKSIKITLYYGNGDNPQDISIGS